MIPNQLPRLAQLFDENLEWAKVIAERVHRKVPPSFDLCDLEQEATIEMWKRCQRYDPFNARGTPFQAYAILAVRGACLMSVRRRAWREATHASIDPRFAPSRDGKHGGRAGPAGDPASRNRRQYDTRGVDMRPLPDEQLIESELAAAEAARVAQQKAWLEEEVAKLSAEDAYLFHQRYVEDVALDDLERASGIPRKMITRRLAGVVRQLKKAKAA